MTLLKLDPERITKLLENYEKAIIQIKKDALSMSWHMRGGLTYEDILNMSVSERNQINELIEHNLEITKKSQLPYF